MTTTTHQTTAKTVRLHEQLAEKPMLTDAGMETDLIFNHGIDLPCFASFDLLSTSWGREAMSNYYRRYLELARKFNSGFILETPTWRASRDWGEKLGYTAEDIVAVNRRSVEFMQSLCEGFDDISPLWISGNIGPRGDGYTIGNAMNAMQARDYHAQQINAFAQTDATLISAFTLNYVEEAIGIALAAQAADIPAVLSFTLETDGCLPSGQQLRSAIEQVEDDTGGYPLYYMINCAHPTHFQPVLQEGGGWLQRLRAIRGNASKCSHAELDQAETLDDGDPLELGRDYQQLRQYLPQLRVYGGCCGTDHRHVEKIAEACLS